MPKIVNNYDFGNNQLLNALSQVLASDPSSPSAGQAALFWFNSTSKTMKHWDGTATQNLTNILESVAVTGGAHLTVSTATKTATLATDGTNTNTPSTLVARDGSGNFSAGTITATLTGTASTAIALAPTANLSLGSFRITTMADPVNAQDAATKNYVDSVVQGLDVHASVRVATTTTLPTNVYANGSSGVGATLTASANGVLTVDGQALVLNDRIMVKNEATQANNGLYSVTTAGTSSVPYVLTRSTDANTSGNLNPGGFAFVEQGTVNAASSWVMTQTSVITFGSTAITWAQFAAGGTYTAGNGMTLTGSSFAVNYDNTTIGLNGSSQLAVLNAVKKYATTLSTSATSYTVTHSLATTDVIVQLLDTLASPNTQIVEADYYIVDSNTVTVKFASAATINQYRVVVLG